MLDGKSGIESAWETKEHLLDSEQATGRLGAPWPFWGFSHVFPKILSFRHRQPRHQLTQLRILQELIGSFDSQLDDTLQGADGNDMISWADATVPEDSIWRSRWFPNGSKHGIYVLEHGHFESWGPRFSGLKCYLKRSGKIPQRFPRFYHSSWWCGRIAPYWPQGACFLWSHPSVVGRKKWEPSSIDSFRWSLAAQEIPYTSPWPPLRRILPIWWWHLWWSTQQFFKQVERGWSWAMRIPRSHCCGTRIWQNSWNGWQRIKP